MKAPAPNLSENGSCEEPLSGVSLCDELASRSMFIDCVKECVFVGECH